jgi:single-strand DNA-binding protein
MASRSLNRITLIGNLTRDPELKYTPQGTAVCTFGIATNRSWATSTGELKEEAQFHRVVAWQKLAELCGKLLSKGRKVYLEGRITYRTFTGKDGLQRSITEIVLDDFILFDNYRAQPSPQPAEEEKPTEEDKEKLETMGKPKKKETAAKEDSDEEEKINPDDIPF